MKVFLINETFHSFGIVDLPCMPQIGHRIDTVDHGPATVTDVLVSPQLHRFHPMNLTDEQLDSVDRGEITAIVVVS